ncbi:uncharacterized protein METZ01_LOCUS279102, partial [marine metagenome]
MELTMTYLRSISSSVLILCAACSVERTPDQSAIEEIEVDHFVSSSPENVSWGWFP